MKKVLVMFCFLAITIPVFAIEKIEGAFGIKLGQQFDFNLSRGTASLTDGTPLYSFKPENKFRSFRQYYVLITPKTNLVYGIWGIGDVDNTEIGKQEQAVIMEILKNKYGEVEKEGFLDIMSDTQQIDQGDRYVLTKVSGFTDITLDIRYYDKKLKTQAEKERIEIEASKVNSDGL